MREKFFLLFIFFHLFSCHKENIREDISFTEIEKKDYEIVFKSQSINKGGSGVICIKKLSKDIEGFYLILNDKLKIDFVNYKKDFFISFFPFPLTYSNLFLSVVIKVSNIENTNFLDIVTIEKSYGVKKIILSKNFGIEKELEFGEKMPVDLNKRYEKILKKFSEKTVFNVYNYTSQNRTYRENFSFNPVPPVSKAKITSDFGVKRKFILNGSQKRSSFHLGIDYVNGKNFDIYSIEDGTVVFSGYNGMSGNFILIDHGFGIYSAYAHCSKLLVNSRDKVKKGELIAISGSTGYATGDHLHFSIIMNGIPVNPHEWFDRNWISTNILPAILKEEV